MLFVLVVFVLVVLVVLLAVNGLVLVSSRVGGLVSVSCLFVSGFSGLVLLVFFLLSLLLSQHRVVDGLDHLHHALHLCRDHVNVGNH